MASVKGRRVLLTRYADFIAAGVIIAYTASMTLGMMPNGLPRQVQKQDCDTPTYRYDKTTTPCLALRQDRGWPVITNQVYTQARPLAAKTLLPQTEFVTPHCGKRCGDTMSFNGILAAAVVMLPVASAYTYHHTRKQPEELKPVKS